MSAAATAAGYLYASGRLRGRAAKDQEQAAEQQAQPKEKRVKVHVEGPQKQAAPRVAVYPQEEKPRRTPKIEYRRRRWSPE